MFRCINGRSTMSEEEESTEEMNPEPNTEAEAPSESSDKGLRDKFRLTPDEKIMKDVKPSIFAFTPMYFIALLILGVHLLFGWGENLAPDDPSVIASILLFLLDIGTYGEIGLVLVMLLITWFNRMLNGTTSGGWTTMFLFIVSITPFVLRLDDFLVQLFSDRETGFIPLDDFYYTFFGVAWSTLFLLFTIFYQRSFHYAITNHRVIFTQHLIIPGDGRRILFDNINEIRTQRTFMGALLGYNTIILDTGSQLGIGEDTMGAGVGTAGGGTSLEAGSIEGQVTKSILRRMFAFLTYQRTRKIDLPDPRYSFFCITNWKAVEGLLNEMHQRHSQSGILSDLKEQLTEN